MSDTPAKLFTPFNIVINLLACGAFFIFFFLYLQPFVPAESPGYVLFFSAATSLCLTMVFFLASFAFTAVLVDERRRKKNGSEA